MVTPSLTEPAPRRVVDHRKRLPGPKGRPAAQREFGEVVRFHVPLQQATLVAHPDHVQHVLQEHHRLYSKDNHDYRILKQIVGEGLLTSDGLLWLRQRRLVQPLIHRRSIAALGDMMTRTTIELR